MIPTLAARDPAALAAAHWQALAEEQAAAFRWQVVPWEDLTEEHRGRLVRAMARTLEPTLTLGEVGE